MENDLISREALKKAIQNREECKECTDIDCIHCFYDIIDNAPTVEQPQGEWINREAVSNTTFPFWERYECNQCHKFNGYSKFCPNCGAKMKQG